MYDIKRSGARRQDGGSLSMRRFLTALAIAATAAVLYVTSAPGAQQAVSPSPVKFAALQQQVHKLQTHLRALQARTTLLTSQVNWTLEMIETARRNGETCLAALTADEFQNTWSQVDRLAVNLGAQPLFGQQTAVSDYNACQGLAVSRPSLDPAVAPTVAPVKGLILWLNGG
jgi:hypothetical protein